MVVVKECYPCNFDEYQSWYRHGIMVPLDGWVVPVHLTYCSHPEKMNIWFTNNYTDCNCSAHSLSNIQIDHKSSKQGEAAAGISSKFITAQYHSLDTLHCSKFFWGKVTNKLS